MENFHILIIKIYKLYIIQYKIMNEKINKILQILMGFNGYVG